MLKFGHASPSGQRILQRCPVTPSPGTHARWPASRTRNLPVGDARDRIPEPAGPLPTRCRCLLPGRTRILAERAKSDETDGRRSTPQPNAVQRPALFSVPRRSTDRRSILHGRCEGSCTSAGQTSRGQGAGMNSGIPSKSSPAHPLPMPPCFASRDLPATCRVTSDRRHVRQLLLETAIFGLTVVVRSGLSQVVPGCGFATVGASDGALRAWLGRLLL